MSILHLVFWSTLLCLYSDNVKWSLCSLEKIIFFICILTSTNVENNCSHQTRLTAFTNLSHQLKLWYYMDSWWWELRLEIDNNSNLKCVLIQRVHNWIQLFSLNQKSFNLQNKGPTRIMNPSNTKSHMPCIDWLITLLIWSLRLW